MKHYRDTLCVLEGQYLQGEAKGRAEGRAEGMTAVARKMKAKGRSAEEIAEMTDLTIEEIVQL